MGTFLNLLLSWALFGLIWVVQLVHYPSFAFVEDKDFSTFHTHHSSSITLIVMPLMLAELGLSTYLAFKNQDYIYWVPLVMVLLIWLSTFLIQVPLHHKLGNGKDLVLIQKLVSSNWIRTILWTIKAVWLGYFFIRLAK